MSEMINRVAEALCYAKPVTFEDMARVAIAAMREPTKGMTKAVEDDGAIQSRLDDCNAHDIPENSWRIMIDEALK